MGALNEVLWGVQPYHQHRGDLCSMRETPECSCSVQDLCLSLLYPREPIDPLSQMRIVCPVCGEGSTKGSSPEVGAAGLELDSAVAVPEVEPAASSEGEPGGVGA